MRYGVPGTLCVIYICSRARAALFEAKTDARTQGPDSYYSFWLARMNVDLVRTFYFPSSVTFYFY